MSDQARLGACHRTSLRVRYEETDAMGVVYYGNYFTWFEVGRTELMRTIGYPYRRMEEEGYRMMVVDAFCKYRAPCRYDQEVAVENWIGDVKNTSVLFEHRVVVEGKVAAEGRTTLVLADRSFSPVKLPEAFKKALLSYRPESA